MMIGRIFPGLVGYVHNRRRKGYDFFPSCYNFFTSGRGDRSRSTVERDLERKSLKMSSKFAKTGILQGKAAGPANLAFTMVFQSNPGGSQTACWEEQSAENKRLSYPVVFSCRGLHV